MATFGKMKCEKCKGSLENGYRVTMMIGSKGYRSYAVCLKCASKLGVKPPVTKATTAAED